MRAVGHSGILKTATEAQADGKKIARLLGEGRKFMEDITACPGAALLKLRIQLLSS
jgi:hypothetical protein